jgi:hypothetical protein
MAGLVVEGKCSSSTTTLPLTLQQLAYQQRQRL